MGQSAAERVLDDLVLRVRECPQDGVLRWCGSFDGWRSTDEVKGT